MSEQKTIKVRATRIGVHGHLREKGEEFEVLEQHFSKRWMESLEPEKPQGGGKGSQSGKGQSAQTASE